MSFPDKLERLINNSGATAVGLAAHQLGSGEEILIDPDSVFHPASTMKICVMLEVFRQARQGTFSLDDLLLIKNEFSSTADGSLYSLSAEDDSEKELYQLIGHQLPIRELVRRMITVSSNLATNILIDLVTPARTMNFMRDLGAESLVIRRGVENGKAFKLDINNAATARGFMQILIKLAKKEAVTAADSDEMLGILAHQQFNEMIPAQLPVEVRVAHKTGWTGQYYHDIGIVYPPHGYPFILVILTRGFENDGQAHAFMGSLAKAIYTRWTK